jgi:hypothetical protein
MMRLRVGFYFDCNPIHGSLKEFKPVLFNRDDVARNITLDFEKHLTVKDDVNIRVRDLWTYKDLGIMTTRFEAKNIPPHGVRVLRLFGVRQYADKKGSLRPSPQQAGHKDL